MTLYCVNLVELNHVPEFFSLFGSMSGLALREIITRFERQKEKAVVLCSESRSRVRDVAAQICVAHLLAHLLAPQSTTPPGSTTFSFSVQMIHSLPKQ